MKQINQLVYLLTISSGGENKAKGKKNASQRGDTNPEMEQEDNGQTFGKIALVQSQDQPRSED